MTADEFSGTLVFRYEALRGGGFGQPLAPELRAGLAVLLRCGMWAWVRAVSAEPDPQRVPNPCGGPARMAPREFINLLADLALGHLGRTS
jgi:hypothetical protein